MKRAIAYAQPIINLNEEPDPGWDTHREDIAREFSLEIIDRTIQVSQRVSQDRIEWENVDSSHELVGCAAAPSDLDLVLTIAINK